MNEISEVIGKPIPRKIPQHYATPEEIAEILGKQTQNIRKGVPFLFITRFIESGWVGSTAGEREDAISTTSYIGIAGQDSSEFITFTPYDLRKSTGESLLVPPEKEKTSTLPEVSLHSSSFIPMYGNNARPDDIKNGNINIMFYGNSFSDPHKPVNDYMYFPYFRKPEESNEKEMYPLELRVGQEAIENRILDLEDLSLELLYIKARRTFRLFTATSNKLREHEEACITDLIYDMYRKWGKFVETSAEVKQIMEIPKTSDLVDDVAAVLMSSGRRDDNRRCAREILSIIEELGSLKVLEENRCQPISDCPGLSLDATVCAKQLKEIMEKVVQ